MQSDIIISDLKRVLNDDEIRQAISALMQDDIVWDSFQENIDLKKVFNTSVKNINCLSPANLSMFLIFNSNNPTAEELCIFPLISIEEPIMIKALGLYEDFLRTPGKPDSLMEAGLLALAMRERYRLTNSWEGLFEEILGNQVLSKHEILSTWRTTFACLYTMIPESDILLDRLLVEVDFDLSVALISHILLSNPLSINEQEVIFCNLIKGLGENQAVRWLKYLNVIGRKEIVSKISSKYLDEYSDEINFIDHERSTNEFQKNIDLAEQYFNRGNLCCLSDNRDAAGVLVQESYKKLLNCLLDLEVQIANLGLQNNEKGEWLYKESKKILNNSALSEYYLSIPNDIFKEKIFDCTVDQGVMGELVNLRKASLLSKEGDRSQARLIAQEAMSNFIEGNKCVWTDYHPNILLDWQPSDFIQILYELDLYNEAIMLAKEILQSRPLDGNIHHLLSKSYQKTEDVEKAYKHASISLVLEPLNIEYHRQIAGIYENLGKWGKAFEGRKHILSLTHDPDVNDWLDFGRCALNINQTSLAIEACHIVIEKQPDNVKGYCLLGKALIAGKQEEEAIEHLVKATKLLPQEEENWLLLAGIFMNHGQQQQALDTLKTAIAINADSEKINYQLSKLYLDLNQPSEAIYYARKAEALNPKTTSTSLLLGKILRTIGKFDEAKKTFSDALEKSPDDFDLNYEYGKLLSDTNKCIEAIPYLEKSLEKYPPEGDRYIEYADALIGRGSEALNGDNDIDFANLKNGKSAIQRALALKSDDFRALLISAEFEKIEGNTQKSFEIYQNLAENAVNANSELRQRTFAGLGQTAFAEGKIDTALVALQECVEKQQDNAHLNRILTDAYLEADLLENAYHSALRARKNAEKDIHILEWFVDVMSNLKETDKAIETLEQLMQLNPEKHQYRLKLIESQIKKGNEKKAADLLEEMCINGNMGYSSDILKQTGDFYHKLRMEEQAIDCYKKALEITSSDRGDLLYEIIKIVQQKNKNEELLNFINNMKIEYPEEVDLDILKMVTLIELGNRDDALVQLETMINSQNQSDLNDRCVYWGKQTSRNDKDHFDVPEAIDQFSGLFPRAALLAFSIGNLKKAYAYLEKALEFYPTNQFLQFLFTEIMQKLYIDEKTSEFVLVLEDWIRDGLSKLSTDNKELSFEKLCLIELICKRAEIAFDAENLEQTEIWIKNGENVIEQLNPHLLCLNAMFLAKKGMISEASQILQKALDLAGDYYGELLQRWQRSFSSIEIISSIKNNWNIWYGDAAIEMGWWEQAVESYSNYHGFNPNEPVVNLKIGKCLVLCAERQRLCMDVDCINHCPGEEKIGEANYRRLQNVLKELDGKIGSDEVFRWKIRGEMAFHPSSEIADKFLSIKLKAEDFSALIMGLRNCNVFHVDESVINEHYQSPCVQLQIAINNIRKNTADCIEDFKEAVLQKGSDPILHFVLAKLAYIANDAVLGYQEILAALDQWNDETKWHQAAAQMAHSIHKIDKKIFHLECIHDLEPENTENGMSLAEAYLSIGEISNALTLLEKYYRKDQQNLALKLLLSSVYQKKGDLKKALTISDEASKLQPNSYKPLLQSADIALAMGRLKLSLNYALQAYEKCSEFGEAGQFLVSLFEKMGEIDRALNILEDVISSNNAPIEAFLLKIRLLKKENDDEDILPFVKEVAAKFPDNLDVLVLLIQTLIECNQLDAAKENAHIGLKINPENQKINVLLGQIYRNLGQLDQAIYQFSSAIKNSATDFEIYLEIGDIYFERRESSKALNSYKEAIRCRPDDYRPYYGTAMILKNGKDYVGAESMLRKALELAPENLDIRRQLGAIIALNLVHNSPVTQNEY